jgi:hypothetical protein
MQFTKKTSGLMLALPFIATPTFGLVLNKANQSAYKPVAKTKKNVDD